nr:hypothetical protein JVH1_6809 [Rhodococcus sp. JVH1]
MPEHRVFRAAHNEFRRRSATRHTRSGPPDLPAPSDLELDALILLERLVADAIRARTMRHPCIRGSAGVPSEQFCGEVSSERHHARGGKMPSCARPQLR